MTARIAHRLSVLGSLLLALLLGACASLPDLPALPDAAPAAAPQALHDTTLARIAMESTPPAKRHLSGLRLLPAGDHAFDARLALARHAERTLDAQYYVIADDDAGRQFLRALRDAAQRGVQVRLLVDDLHSGDVADLLAGLAAHERVEVRLFNPLPLRSGAPMTRLLASPSQFEQLHRRMHNKLFIADGHVAVTGGRNVADEYFMHSSAANFVDMDILATGQVLGALTQAFDRYWNSPHAYPLQTLQGDGDAAARRERFDAQVQRALPLAAPTGRDLLDHSAVSRQLAEGHLELLFAPVQVLADAPDKVVQTATLDDSALGQGLGRLREARSEVVIVSPYFIPGVRGMAMLREATAAQCASRC